MNQGINTLADRAMLVSVRLSQFEASKKDSKITAEVAQQHGIADDMGSYTKKLLPKAARAKLVTLTGEIRTGLKRRTLPWSEDGARILSQAGFFECSEWANDMKARWDKTVSEFLSMYDQHVAEARASLNSGFNPSDYPSIDQLRSRFAFRFIVRPLPVSEDWRVTVGDEQLATIRSAMDAELREVIAAGMADVVGQIRDVVTTLADRLKKFDANEPRKHPLMGAYMDNIAKLVEVLPQLNITNDAGITALCGQMQELAKFDIQGLRDSQWKRDDVAARADAILAQMTQFVA